MLLASFYINYTEVFDLVLTGGNTKNTEKIQVYGKEKYKKYSVFSKKC